ncbi:conserved hypothetical protein [Kluyveromyces marxianus]|nr:conserved hypothetical protein [Kluyveromyces marxianus]
MSTTRFLSFSSRFGGLSSTSQQVLQFKGFDQVRVPDHGSVSGLDISEGLVDGGDVLNTFVQRFLCSKDGDILLHSLLHSQSDLSSWLRTSSVSQLVQVSNGFFTQVSWQRLVWQTWL